jgi:hypothetical protein
MQRATQHHCKTNTPKKNEENLASYRPDWWRTQKNNLREIVRITSMPPEYDVGIAMLKRSENLLKLF